MKRRSRFFLFAFITSLITFSLGLSAQGSEVYVRNKNLQVTSSGVNFPKLLRILSDEERERILVSDGSVQVKAAGEGNTRTFELGPGVNFSQWEELLVSLGYRRYVDPQSGTVDFLTPSLKEESSAQSGQANELTEEHKLVYSRKRPGYRQGQINFNKAMETFRLSKLQGERERVQRIGKLIVQQSPLTDLHWTFEVVDTPIPNALCTGEGFVIVTEGLLDLGLTDDELAGVLGHEVAHGVRRHNLVYPERYQEYVQMANRLRKLNYQLRLAQENGTERDARRLRQEINSLEPRWNFVVDYLKNKQAYNRHEEEEADVLGVQYATAAGFDPMGEGRALVKLKKRSVELFGQGFAEGSRSHPSLKRRLEILNLVLNRRSQRDD